MRYRIKEDYDSAGFRYFRPQYMYRFFPFWLYWWTTYTGHDHSNVGFYKKEEAEEFIKNEIEKKKIVRGKRLHDFDG
ncbi:hypothetical protein [uncultured Endozoicomonas sp.]|uniref:hypothetical protein n=1 Tax=uncultured Endozoicomonas sp. TaxID=432652 RepID=UPI00261662B2|nr:hypothetical protein [uncultured Endozoicomonas sp.]